MSYPTPPAPRIAYDLDGTVGILGPGPASGMTAVQMSTAGLAALNGDTGVSEMVAHWRTGVKGTGYYQLAATAAPLSVDPLPWAALLFPRPMQLSAFFGHIITYGEGQFGNAYSGVCNFQPFSLQTSTDTTNGVDGTWRTVLDVSAAMAPVGNYGNTPLDVMDGILPTNLGSVDPSTWGPEVNASHRLNGDLGGFGWKTLTGAWLRNVVGVRFLIDRQPADVPAGSAGYSFVGAKFKAHLYGLPETSFDPNWLTFTDTSGVFRTFDFGNVRQGDILTTSFKVKNTSSTLTAHAPIINIGPPDPGPSPTLSAQISLDGSTWVNTLTLPDLAPGASSATIQVQVLAPTFNLLGNWAPRLNANAGSWS